MTEEKKSLIEYPSEFPIKVMGKVNPEYLPAILHIARQFDPTFDESKVEQRPSKDGNYLGKQDGVVLILEKMANQ